jgi:hypothetical protein
VVLYRAAQTLHAKGLIDFWHTGLAGGTNSTWVTRPGYQCRRDQVPRLSVDTGFPETHSNTAETVLLPHRSVTVGLASH